MGTYIAAAPKPQRPTTKPKPVEVVKEIFGAGAPKQQAQRQSTDKNKRVGSGGGVQQRVVNCSHAPRETSTENIYLSTRCARGVRNQLKPLEVFENATLVEHC